jgi:hypothetical protein
VNFGANVPWKVTAIILVWPGDYPCIAFSFFGWKLWLRAFAVGLGGLDYQPLGHGDQGFDVLLVEAGLLLGR